MAFSEKLNFTKWNHTKRGPPVVETISLENLVKLYNRNCVQLRRVLMPSWHVLTLRSRLLQCNMGSWKFSDLFHDFFGFDDTACTAQNSFNSIKLYLWNTYFCEIEKLMTRPDKELENQLKIRKLPYLYHKVKLDFLILRMMSVTGGKIIKLGLIHKKCLYHYCWGISNLTKSFLLIIW